MVLDRYIFFLEVAQNGSRAVENLREYTRNARGGLAHSEQFVGCK